MVTGYDLSVRTFQYKIDSYWGETEQWHSFYSQMANDFHFIGVAFIMFFLGFLLSKVWLSVLFYDSFYGKMLIPLFAILVIFIPANNQVFGFAPTLSYFIIVLWLWFFEYKKIRIIR